MNNKPSMCRQCVYGHCVEQTQRAAISSHASFDEELPEEFDNLGIADMFTGSGDDMPSPTEEVVTEMEFTLCYWAAKKIHPTQSPAMVHIVRECDRFEQRGNAER